MKNVAPMKNALHVEWMLRAFVIGLVEMIGRDQVKVEVAEFVKHVTPELIGNITRVCVHDTGEVQIFGTRRCRPGFVWLRGDRLARFLTWIGEINVEVA